MWRVATYLKTQRVRRNPGRLQFCTIFGKHVDPKHTVYYITQPTQLTDTNYM